MKSFLETRDFFNIDNMIKIQIDDFISFPINTSTLSDSNIFLNNLWQIFDSNISIKTLNRCPWYYIPDKIILKNKNITFFGSIRTRYGYIYVAISYKKKGSINELLLFSFDIDIAEKRIKNIFNNLIKETKKISFEKNIFSFKCSFSIKNSFLSSYPLQSFKEYKGDSFIILKNRIYINIEAYGLYNAEKLAFEKINEILIFLSIETNSFFEIKKIITLKSNPIHRINNKKFNFLYQENYYKNDQFAINGNFIDFIPLDSENNLLLSNSASLFIDLILKTDLLENVKLRYFINACKHFSLGLKEHWKEINFLVDIGKEAYVTLSKKNFDTSILNKSITHYLSAIEIMSLIGHKKNTCSSCHQPIYQINQRVHDFIIEYLWPHQGEVFKKIYDLRSKYLHVGETTVSNFKPNFTRPLLDINTATGSLDFHISLSCNGQIGSVSIENIQEWTSFSFRNFYKKTFLNIQE